MAEPKQKSWFEKATEKAGEFTGGVLGTLGGALGEARRFYEDIPESVVKLTSPFETFREFQRELDVVRRGGGAPPEKIESGLVRVVSGLAQLTGPEKKGELKAGESKFQDSPFYEATKRDLLNIGEGLVDLGATAIGFNREALQRAEAQRQAEAKQTGKKPAQGFAGGFERGATAGVKAGEEFTGGVLATGLIPVVAGMDVVSGTEGKKLYREAPVATALSLLPVLKGVGNALKAGNLSAAQVAEVNRLVGNTKNPRTGKPFVSLDELTSTLDEIEANQKKGVPPTTQETTLLQQAQKPLPTQQALTGKAVKQMGEKGLAKGVAVAEQVVSKAPFVAAAYSLGGTPAAVLTGGAMLASPLLETFQGLAKGTKAGKVAGKLAQAKTKFERATQEPRTYETEVAQAVGEEALTTPGEVKTLDVKVGDFPEKLAQTPPEVLEVPAMPEMPVEKDLGPQATEAQKLAEQQRVAVEKEKIEQQRKRQFPVETQVPIEEGRELIVGEEGGVERAGVKPTEKRLSVNPESQTNKPLFDELKGRLEGSGLNVYDQRRLFATLAASREIPELLLSDPAVRAKTIELIERFSGKKLTPDGKTLLDQTLAKIGDDVFADPRALTQEGRSEAVAGVPTITGKQFQVRRANTQETTPLSSVVDTAVEELKINRQRAVFNNFLNNYQKRLMVSGGGSTPTGGLTGPAGFTTLFNSAVEQGRRERLVEFFDALQGREPDLRSVSNKKKALELVNQELVEPFDQRPEYKAFVQNLKRNIELMKEGKEGVATFESVAELPVERPFDTSGEAVDAIGTAVGAYKRLLTTYNPAVVFGNFVGNAFVESMNTGKLPPAVIAEQAQSALRFGQRVKEARATGKLSLQDEIALRAIPKDTMLTIEAQGNVPFVEGSKSPLKLAQWVYRQGDTMPKTAEAVKQSGMLLEAIERMPKGEMVVLRTGDGMFVSVIKSGEVIDAKTGKKSINVTLINPKTGNVVTSGALESNSVKRVLGSAVKASIDAKFPDVSQVPSWFRNLASNKTATGKLAGLVVFQPFMSYVVRAMDTPYRRGLLSNIMDLGSDPVVFQTARGPLNRAGGPVSIFNQIMNDTKRVRNYFNSRGLMNSFYSRYNELSPQERQDLREYFSFYPTDVRALAIGELMNLESGEQTRKFSTPSYATFWSKTDSMVKTIPAITNLIGEVTGKSPEQVAKELGSENPMADKVLTDISKGNVTSATDVLDAYSVAGGVAKDFFIQLTDKTLGKKPVDKQFLVRHLGVIGKVLGDEKLTELTGDDKVDAVTVFKYFTDLLVGSQILDPRYKDTKLKKFISDYYNQGWNTTIQPLIKQAEALQRQGKEAEAEELLSLADDINENLIEVIEKNIDAREQTLNKIGIQPDIRTRDFKRVWRDVETREPMPKIEQEEEEEEQEPKEENE